MTERPILFSTPMVQAILAGRKSMTRRVVKDPRRKLPGDHTEKPNFPCPYGQVGDRLWVRERALYWVSPIVPGVEYDKPSDWWSDCAYFDDPEISGLLADNNRMVIDHVIQEVENGHRITGQWEWKTGMFMPRHYSRITLEITNIRVERLQEITPEDAAAEGADYMPAADVRDEQLTVSQIVFAGLWDKLNSKTHLWESNPFVWVIEFVRCSHD